jgi:hypothetical protein
MSLTPFTSERAPTRNTFVTRGTDSDLLVGFVLASQAWQTGDLKSVRYESHPVPQKAQELDHTNRRRSAG